MQGKHEQYPHDRAEDEHIKLKPPRLPEKSTLASQADGLFGWQHVIDKQKTCA